jgi:hypothetical protein
LFASSSIVDDGSEPPISKKQRTEKQVSWTEKEDKKPAAKDNSKQR